MCRSCVWVFFGGRVILTVISILRGPLFGKMPTRAEGLRAVRSWWLRTLKKRFYMVGGFIFFCRCRCSGCFVGCLHVRVWLKVVLNF